MDVRLVEQFVTIAAELNVTRAAERLMVSQSTVSAGLRRFERELGVTLFVRTTRSMTLTPAGERLLPAAEALLASAAHLHDLASESTGRLRGRVRLGTFAALDLLDLPGVVASFRGRHPQVDLALTASPRGSTGLEEDLRRGRVDLAFLALPDQPSDLTVEPLLSSPFVALVPGDHRLAGRSRVGLDELADESWVDTAAGFGNRVLLDRHLAGRGLTRRLVVETGDLPSVTGFVAAGVGVAVVPAVALLPAGSDGCVVVPLADGPPDWRIGLGRRRGVVLSRAARALVADLQAAAAASAAAC
ncbi:MAG: LysR family transcriptional regulator [Terracoccus sp.]